MIVNSITIVATMDGPGGRAWLLVDSLLETKSIHEFEARILREIIAPVARKETAAMWAKEDAAAHQMKVRNHPIVTREMALAGLPE